MGARGPWPNIDSARRAAGSHWAESEARSRRSGRTDPHLPKDMSDSPLRAAAAAPPPRTGAARTAAPAGTRRGAAGRGRPVGLRPGEGSQRRGGMLGAGTGAGFCRARPRQVSLQGGKPPAALRGAPRGSAPLGAGRSGAAGVGRPGGCRGRCRGLEGSGLRDRRRGTQPLSLGHAFPVEVMSPAGVPTFLPSRSPSGRFGERSPTSAICGTGRTGGRAALGSTISLLITLKLWCTPPFPGSSLFPV